MAMLTLGARAQLSLGTIMWTHRFSIQGLTPPHSVRARVQGQDPVLRH